MSSQLVLDELQYVEILTAFNEKICVPLYRNGSEYGFDKRVIEIFSNFSKLQQVHESLGNDLKSLPSLSSEQQINAIFCKYIDEFKKTDIDLIMDRVYENIAAILQLSWHDKLMHMLRRFNYEHQFTNIGVDALQRTKAKEEPQLISYILYLSLRVFRYIDHYKMHGLLDDHILFKKCCDIHYNIECALYLLCLQGQISQCQIQLFLKNRVLVRIEKLSMVAGKFKKKQKKRLLVLTNDRIIWCSILPQSTKKGEKYKYKGSYKMKDEQFQIKPFYANYGNDEQGDEHHHDEQDESMYSTMNTEHMHMQHASHHSKEQFGFKFGLNNNNNEKSFKIIVCSEQQQQVWCKDINKCIVAPNSIHNQTQFKCQLNLQSIDLLERFIKHCTGWHREKIWHKIFDSKLVSVTQVILSLFDDLLESRSKPQHAVHPPPLPLTQHQAEHSAEKQQEQKEAEPVESEPEEDEEEEEEEEEVEDEEDDEENREESVSNASASNESNEDESNEESMNGESNALRQELNEYKKQFKKLQRDYKMLENENTRLSARNAFLNNRLIALSNLRQDSNLNLGQTKHSRQATRGQHATRNVVDGDAGNDDDADLDVEDDEEEDDAVKYMKMISHKRKNSDSTQLNKSPSFLSTLREDNNTQIDKDEFYLNCTDSVNSKNTSKHDDEKMIQPSKSRDEMIYQHHRHKKKPKKKARRSDP